MDFTFGQLVNLTPAADGEEALVCGPEGCSPAPETDPEPGPADAA